MYRTGSLMRTFILWPMMIFPAFHQPLLSPPNATRSAMTDAITAMRLLPAAEMLYGSTRQVWCMVIFAREAAFAGQRIVLIGLPPHLMRLAKVNGHIANKGI